MSAPPPVPPQFAPPQQQRTSSFPWLACGIGCLLLLVLVAALIAFGVYKAKQAFDDLEAWGEEMQEVDRRQREAHERLTALDETHPPSLPEDLGSAELTDAELEQYLGLHAALAEPLAAHAAVTNRIADLEERVEDLETNPEPSLREAFGLVAEVKDAFAAEFEAEKAMADVIQAAADHAEAQGYGRTQLRRLIAIVDWHFLEREGFEELGLSAEDWQLLESKRMTAQYWEEIPDETPPDWEPEAWEEFRQELLDDRATIDRLEANAAATRGVLTDATRAKLESRRAELEAVSHENALAVLELTREPPDWAAFDWDDEWSEEPMSGSEGGADHEPAGTTQP